MWMKFMCYKIVDITWGSLLYISLSIRVLYYLDLYRTFYVLERIILFKIWMANRPLPKTDWWNRTELKPQLEDKEPKTSGIGVIISRTMNHFELCHLDHQFFT